MKGKKKKYFKSSKMHVYEKELERLVEIMKENVVLVEGKRDVRALGDMDIPDVIPIVGRLESALKRIGPGRKVIILTDLDRKGHIMAEKCSELLWSRGVKYDLEVRKELGKILKVRHFENLSKKYDKFRGE